MTPEAFAEVPNRELTNVTLTVFRNSEVAAVEKPDTLARLRPATPSTPLRPVKCSLEGLEVGTFELGDPPGLELDIAIASVNDFLRTVQGRQGSRDSDAQPLSVGGYELLVHKGLHVADGPARLLMSCASAARIGRCLHINLDQVELRVREPSLVENGIVKRLRVEAVVHHNLLRDFAPWVGHAGYMSMEPCADKRHRQPQG
jgi:hypothetical protein